MTEPKWNVTGKRASRRPFAWCRLCRRRRFIFCVTVHGACCWECFKRAATTRQERK